MREMDVKFQVGDLVTDKDNTAVFVVVGRVRKSGVINAEYDVYSVVQIYSHDEDEMFECDLRGFEIKDGYLDLHASRGSDRHANEIASINDIRDELGYEDIEYESLLTDYIDYERFKTVDEYLDVINDLENLYAIFGDDEYIKKKDEIVKHLTKRLRK